MYDIICIGGSSIDVFVRTSFNKLIKHSKKKHMPVDLQAYPLGSKILIDELHFTTGGGGTNTAVALSRLGHKVAYLGKTGNDNNADLIEINLKKENVDSMIIRDPKYSTGYSIILDSVKHDRTILTHKGANDFLKWKEIQKALLISKWFYFSTMMGSSFRTLKKLARFAEKNNIKIAFNISEYLAKKGIRYLKPILKRTKLLVLNKEESLLLTKEKTTAEAFKKLKQLGIGIIVITDGPNGASAFDGRHLYTIFPHNVKVVETTGAGDAFASSFLSGIMQKGSIEHALQLAQINAESVIQYHGAKNKLLTYDEAQKLMKKLPEKMIVSLLP